MPCHGPRGQPRHYLANNSTVVALCSGVFRLDFSHFCGHGNHIKMLMLCSIETQIRDELMGWLLASVGVGQ